MLQKFKPYSLRSAFGIVPEEEQSLVASPPNTLNPPTQQQSAPPTLAPTTTPSSTYEDYSRPVIEYVYVKPTCQRCRCSHCIQSHNTQEFLLWIITIVVVFILIKVLSI
jgi:hypothetical protein